MHRSTSFPKAKKRNVCLNTFLLGWEGVGRWVGGEVWKAIMGVKGELFLGGGISDYFNLIPYAFLFSILPIFYHKNIFLF